MYGEHVRDIKDSFFKVRFAPQADKDKWYQNDLLEVRNRDSTRHPDVVSVRPCDAHIGRGRKRQRLLTSAVIK